MAEPGPVDHELSMTATITGLIILEGERLPVAKVEAVVNCTCGWSLKVDGGSEATSKAADAGYEHLKEAG